MWERVPSHYTELSKMKFRALHLISEFLQAQEEHTSDIYPNLAAYNKCSHSSSSKTSSIIIYSINQHPKSQLTITLQPHIIDSRWSTAALRCIYMSLYSIHICERAKSTKHRLYIQSCVSRISGATLFRGFLEREWAAQGGQAWRNDSFPKIYT